MQMNQQIMGKSKMKDWCNMKMQLNEQFLPFDYMQTFYKNLHNLR